METGTREEIAAAAGAYADLGRDYDAAVAEGLVERIGAEIDKRIDARLAQRGPASPHPAWVAPVIAIGSLGAGLVATVATLFARISIGPGVVHGNGALASGAVHNRVYPGQIVLVALVWVAIAAVNVAYAWSERRR